MYGASIARTHHSFPDLKDVLAKASPRKSGDELAGLAASSAQEREAARLCLSELPLALFLQEQLIPYQRTRSGESRPSETRIGRSSTDTSEGRGRISVHCRRFDIAIGGLAGKRQDPYPNPLPENRERE